MNGMLSSEKVWVKTENWTFLTMTIGWYGIPPNQTNSLSINKDNIVY